MSREKSENSGAGSSNTRRLGPVRQRRHYLLRTPAFVYFRRRFFSSVDSNDNRAESIEQEQQGTIERLNEILTVLQTRWRFHERGYWVEMLSEFGSGVLGIALPEDGPEIHQFLSSGSSEIESQQIINRLGNIVNLLDSFTVEADATLEVAIDQELAHVRGISQQLYKVTLQYFIRLVQRRTETLSQQQLLAREMRAPRTPER